MSSMDTKQIKRSMRIDYLRLAASGEGSVWILALVPLAFTFIGFIVDDEAITFGAAGAVAAICALYAAFSAMMVFSNEETTGNTSMNGIVPVSRPNQVFARFALGFAADVITAVEGVLCLLILFHHDEPSVLLFAGLGLGVFGVSLFLGGVVIPIFYKFAVTKAMGWSFAILGLLFFAVFLVGKIMSDDMRKRMVEWITTARLGVVPWAAIIAVLVAVVVCVCSFLVSVRIYERKEL
ncbi:ABC-2 transporter permease [Bifidobacterium sp. ESL0690]|uniref:ABC-2 transporter permease n=1 Tax=Bifidobacterium sp. ESL0690 TaxID=2983214 RepID=UPI0023F6D988|nr:ABC-2 transporter permease [Bifidobacterium sp. ESL0690]WEV45948.1 ABC-2 transporter permease [Bifidobacterium sp. ESL0690]